MKLSHWKQPTPAEQLGVLRGDFETCFTSWTTHRIGNGHFEEIVNDFLAELAHLQPFINAASWDIPEPSTPAENI